MGMVRRLLGGTVRLALVGAGVGLLVTAGAAWYVQLMSEGRIVAAHDVPEAPVALVLGAEIYPDGTPSRYLKARLDLAEQLYRDGKVRAILVSGDNGSAHYNETDGMRNYLISRGIPPVKVVGDHAGFDTYDSCVRAKRVFGVNRAIVVSQTYHLPRAVSTCRAVGVDAWAVGDETAKVNQQMWTIGSVREYAANLKMIVDVFSQREPTLGPRETGVDEALASR